MGIPHFNLDTSDDNFDDDDNDESEADPEDLDGCFQRPIPRGPSVFIGFL